MNTSSAPMAPRPFAPSDRKLASAWIRDLKTGAAVRRCLRTGADVAFVFERAGEWSFIAPEIGRRATRELAKATADLTLLCAGYRLVDVPGHELERE